MRAVVQRVLRAEVVIDGEVVGECGPGLLVYVAAAVSDTPREAKRLADRVFGLRIFGDENGRMNLSLSQTAGIPSARILVISNFTLYGDAWSSRRPSFMNSAPYDVGEELYNAFLAELESLAPGQIASGQFGADMKVTSINDGPVTLVIDAEAPT